LSEVEHRERAPASEYEDLKKDFEDMRAAYEAVVKEKAEVEEIKRATLQWFKDSLCKKLAELRRDMEASVATLGGRSAEFPTDISLCDFLEWFQTEVAAMPTAFVECNENITCYALIGVSRCLREKGMNISRSSKSWLFPVMPRSFMISPWRPVG
jgi:hypothetical protein